MMSKPLKNLGRFRGDESATKLGKLFISIVDFLKMNIYYPLHNFYSRYKERIGRSLAFAKIAWLNYDFESAYIYNLMAFKMRRIYRTLKKGFAIQHPEDMKALKEAIDICDRLFEGNYDDKYHKVHDKKWGKIRTKDVPVYDDEGKLKYHQWKTSRKNVKTKKQLEVERKEFLDCWKYGEKDRVKDLNRLNQIFKKYQPSWWD